MFAPFRVIDLLKWPKRFSTSVAGVSVTVLVAIVSPGTTMLAVAVSRPKCATSRLRLSTMQPEYIVKHRTSDIPVSTEEDGSAQFPERDS